MSAIVPIAAPSASTMVRPRQARTLSMLGWTIPVSSGWIGDPLQCPFTRMKCPEHANRYARPLLGKRVHWLDGPATTRRRTVRTGSSAWRLAFVGLDPFLANLLGHLVLLGGHVLVQPDP